MGWLGRNEEEREGKEGEEVEEIEVEKFKSSRVQEFRKTGV